MNYKQDMTSAQGKINGGQGCGGTFLCKEKGYMQARVQQTTIPSQTPLIWLDTEGAIESARINGVYILTL